MAKRRWQRWFLKEWRKHRGLTQQQLADALETTTSRISELETGSERYNQDVLEKLAEALSAQGDIVTPADLISRRPGEAPDPFKLWYRIPEPERARAARVIGRVMEDWIIDLPAATPAPPPPSARKRKPRA